ncbi:ABC transporter permease subunit [Oceanobacillus piezotolerans]|uniref:ABC transporter permease subunit n=1 Tax=Oceanobacillus piezotolerans TaxID=2448030 RepID=A0A498DBJ2_9BACI|nr:ABC transporter permease subunit [Oceanobacillus piezotolerans]RLL48381.1 ABC transporter permease subunit [Oceanobacillus piezotolerans]
MKVINFFLFYLLGLIGIVFISIIPEFISLKSFKESPSFFTLFIEHIQTLLDPKAWEYRYFYLESGYPIFEVLQEPFIYSMKILLGAVFSGVIFALILALIVTCLPSRITDYIKRIVDFMESIPDLIIAALLQAITIKMFQITDIKLFNVAAYSEDIYFAPILTLSILPMISMFKVFMHLFEEELSKTYILFLKAKGMNGLEILIKHSLRNIMPAFTQRLKVIIFGMLSSQFIIERIFNVHGLTYYLLESFTPITISFVLFMIFTPFYVLFYCIDLWANKENLYFNDIRNKKTSIKRVYENFIITNQIRIKNLCYNVKHFRVSRYSLHRHLKACYRAIAVYFKEWKVIVGSLFFVVAIGYSVIYSVITDNYVGQEKFLYKDDGITLAATPPYARTDPFIFGSDQFGFSIFDQLVVWSKIYLVIWLIDCFFTCFWWPHFWCNLFFLFKPKKSKMDGRCCRFSPFYAFKFDSLYSQYFAFSISERIVWEVFILTILVLPVTTVLTGKEINEVLSRDYISSSKMIGGSSTHLFIKHIIPHIGPKLAILFGQQFIQVLLIFIHLGVFNLFFGGTKNSAGFEPSAISITYEWSGLIGAIGRGAIISGYYWYLWVLVAFMLAIFAMQLIIQGIVEIQQRRMGVISKGKKPINRGKSTPYPRYQVNENSFKLTNKVE